MTLTLEPILRGAGIDPRTTQVLRHAYVREHDDTGLRGIHADSTDEEILTYTSIQSVNPRIFPLTPPPVWVVFVREGGDRARLWSVVENHGEISSDGRLRTFDLTVTDHLADLRNRLVVGWRSPRTWASTVLPRLPTRSWRSPTPGRSHFPGSIGLFSTTHSSKR